MTFIQLNGLTYHYKDTGSGDVLLLLHGFTGSRSIWEPFISEFSLNYRVLIIDLPGHGLTALPENLARYRMQHVADDLIFMMKQLTIKKFHLLGYSMGGRLALYLSLHYTDNLMSLILESTSPGLRIEAERQHRQYHDNSLADRIENIGIEAFVTFWENLPLFASQKSLPQLTRQQLRSQRLQNNSIGLANSLRGMGAGIQPSLWDALKKLNTPTLIIAGERDVKFTTIASQMHHEIANSVIQIVPDAGHAIHLEQPAIFSQSILNFLNEHRSQ